eukprot:SM000203S06133  [mRNA]  locus=s203:60593:61880:+ [translate_table: standard]
MTPQRLSCDSSTPLHNTPLSPGPASSPNPLDLSAEALRVALTKAPRMVSGGPSGWLFEDLQDLFLDGDERSFSLFLVAWSPRGLPANLELPHGCQTPANGLAILKVPFGTPAHMAVDLRERLQKHLAPLPSLPLLGDTQLALAILTRCIGQRACYLQRTVAPLGMEYDDSLQQSLASLLHSSSFPSASASLQASLPTRMGGLGCLSLEQTAQAAFLGCWHQIASLLPMRFPCLHDP